MLQMEPTWDNLFEASLRKRVDPEDFIRFVNTFQSKYAVVPGRELMVVLLAQHRKPNLVPEDPRLPLYARGLLRSGVCSAADVIASLFSSSSSSSSSESLEGPKTGIDLFDGLNLETSVPRPSVGARIVQMLTLEIAEGLLKSTEEVRDVLKSVVALAVQLPNSNALGYLVSAILSSPFSGDALGRSTSTKSTTDAAFSKASGKSTLLII